MLGRILTNNSQKTNNIIFATIELNQLIKIYNEKLIDKDKYYYLKDEIIKEYKVFSEIIWFYHSTELISQRREKTLTKMWRSFYAC